MNTKMTLAALAATVGLVGCQKAAEQVKNEVQKKGVQAEMAGNWYLDCTGSKTLDAASERTKYDFAVNGSKTVQLFSDGQCRDKIGEIKYTGKVTVGNEIPEVPGARTLDLEYNKVTVKFDDQKVVDTLNSKLMPSCGINDLKVGEEREITQKAKTDDKNVIDKVVDSIQCPVAAAKPVHDIVKADGSRITFGMSSPTADKSTQEKRPKQLDTDEKNVLKREG